MKNKKSISILLTITIILSSIYLAYTLNHRRIDKVEASLDTVPAVIKNLNGQLGIEKIIGPNKYNRCLSALTFTYQNDTYYFITFISSSINYSADGILCCGILKNGAWTGGQNLSYPCKLTNGPLASYAKCEAFRINGIPKVFIIWSEMNPMLQKHQIKITTYTPNLGWSLSPGNENMASVPGIDGYDNLHPSIWLDVNNNPIVSWIATNNGQNLLMASFWNNSNNQWCNYNGIPGYETVSFPAQYNNFSAFMPTIKINKSSQPTILFKNNTQSGSDVFLIQRTQTTWETWNGGSISPLFYTPGILKSYHMDYMQNGFPEVTYIDGMESMVYSAYWIGSQWFWRTRNGADSPTPQPWSLVGENPTKAVTVTNNNTSGIIYFKNDTGYLPNSPNKPNTKNAYMLCQMDVRTKCYDPNNPYSCPLHVYYLDRRQYWNLINPFEPDSNPDDPGQSDPNEFMIIVEKIQNGGIWITYEGEDPFLLTTIPGVPTYRIAASYICGARGAGYAFQIEPAYNLCRTDIDPSREIVIKRGETKKIKLFFTGMASYHPIDGTLIDPGDAEISRIDVIALPTGVSGYVTPNSGVIDSLEGFEAELTLIATSNAVQGRKAFSVKLFDDQDDLRGRELFYVVVKNVGVEAVSPTTLYIHKNSTDNISFKLDYYVDNIATFTPSLIGSLPPGLSYSFSDTSIVPPDEKDCIITFTTTTDITPSRIENLSVRFQSYSGDAVDIPITIIITVFELEAEQPFKKILQSDTQVVFNLNVIPDVGYDGNVSLYLDGLPNNIYYSYNISPGNDLICDDQVISVTLTITFSQPLNERIDLVVRGRSYSDDDVKQINLSVMRGKFYAWATQIHSGLLPGDKGTWLINIESFSTETFNVQLSSTGLPYNWSSCFDFTQVELSDDLLEQVSFTISVPKTETQKDIEVTILLSGGNESVSIILPISVQGYRIEFASDASVAIDIGESRIIDVSVVSENGYAGPVTMLAKIDPPVWWLEVEFVNNPIYCLPNGTIGSLVRISVDGGAPYDSGQKVSLSFVSEAVGSGFKGWCTFSSPINIQNTTIPTSIIKPLAPVATETLKITVNPVSNAPGKLAFLTPSQKILRQVKHVIGEKPIQSFNTNIPFLAMNVYDPLKYEVKLKEVQIYNTWNYNECFGKDYAFLAYKKENMALSWSVDSVMPSLLNEYGYCDKVYENVNCTFLPQECNQTKQITTIRQAYWAIGRPSISSISPGNYSNVMSKIYSSEDAGNGNNTNICIDDIRVLAGIYPSNQTQDIDIALPLRIMVPFIGVFQVKSLINGAVEIKKVTSTTLIIYEKPLPNHSQGAEKICEDWYAGDTHVHSSCGGTRMGQPSYEGEEVVDGVLVGCRYKCDCNGSIEYPGGPSVIQRAEEARELNFDFMYLADHVVGGACSDNANLAWKTAMTVNTSTNDPDNLMVAIQCPEPDPQSDPIVTGCGCARVWNYIKAFNRDTMMIGKDPNGYTNSQETAYQFYNCEFSTPPPPAPPPIELPPDGAALCDYGQLTSQVSQTNNPVSSIINNQAVSCNGCQGHLVSNYRGSKIEPFINNKLLTLRRSNTTCEKTIPPCNAFPVPQNKQQTFWKYITSIITHPHETSCGSSRMGQTFIKETDKIYPHQNEEPMDPEFPGIHGFPWQYPENLNTTDPWGDWPIESPYTYPDEGMTHRAHPMTGCTAATLPYVQRIPNIYGYDGMEVVYEGYNLSFKSIHETYDRWNIEVGKELGSVVHDDIHPLDKNIINWVPNEGPPVKFERDIWHPFPVGASNVLRWWMEPWCRYYGKNMTYIHAREFTATPNDTKTTGLRHPLGYYLRVGKTVASGAGSFATMWLGTSAGGIFYPDGNPNNTNCNTDTNTFQPGDIIANGYPIPEYKSIAAPVNFRILLKSAWTGGKPKKVTVYLDRWGDGTQQEPPRVYTKGFKTWDLSDCGTPITDPNDYWYYIDDFYTPGQIGTGPWCLNVTAEFSNPNGPDEVVICAPIYSKR